MKGWIALVFYVIAYDLAADTSLSHLFWKFSRRHPVLMAALWGYLTVHLWMYKNIRRYDPLSRGRHLLKGTP